MAGTDYWNSKLSKNIQCKKNNHLVFLIFNISETLPEYQEKNYISGIIWAFKSKLKIIHAATYIALCFPDSNCFFIFLVPLCPYLSLLFSNFVSLFSPSFSFSSRHNTHSTIYNVWFYFISTCPFFLLSYQITFFLVFDQIIFS